MTIMTEETLSPSFFAIRMLLHNISAREALTLFCIKESSSGLSGDIFRDVGQPCRNTYGNDIRDLEKRGLIDRKMSGGRGGAFSIGLTTKGEAVLKDLFAGKD